jgi:hypothetical protein
MHAADEIGTFEDDLMNTRIVCVNARRVDKKGAEKGCSSNPPLVLQLDR